MFSQLPCFGVCTTSIFSFARDRLGAERYHLSYPSKNIIDTDVLSTADGVPTEICGRLLEKEQSRGAYLIDRAVAPEQNLKLEMSLPSSQCPLGL
jgi:hypothetical protein